MDDGPLCRQTDARIARDIQTRLAGSPYAETRCVVVECDDGVVVLRGQVDRFYHRQIAQALARDVDGVRSVVDRITVREPDD